MAEGRDDIVRIDESGIAHPVGETARVRLQGREGEFHVLASPPNLLLLRRETSDPGDARACLLSGEIRAAGTLADVASFLGQKWDKGELVVLDQGASRSLFVDGGRLVAARSSVVAERNADALAQTRAVLEGALRVDSGVFYFLESFDAARLVLHAGVPLTTLVPESLQRIHASPTVSDGIAGGVRGAVVVYNEGISLLLRELDAIDDGDAVREQLSAALTSTPLGELLAGAGPADDGRFDPERVAANVGARGDALALEAQVASWLHGLASYAMILAQPHLQKAQDGAQRSERVLRAVRGSLVPIAGPPPPPPIAEADPFAPAFPPPLAPLPPASQPMPYVAPVAPVAQAPLAPPVRRSRAPWIVAGAVAIVVLFVAVALLAKLARSGLAAPPPAPSSADTASSGPAADPAASTAVAPPADSAQPAGSASVEPPAASSAPPEPVLAKPDRWRSVLVVVCQPACDTVFVDGKSFHDAEQGIVLNPGVHMVGANLGRRGSKVFPVALKMGQTRRVDIDF